MYNPAEDLRKLENKVKELGLNPEFIKDKDTSPCYDDGEITIECPGLVLNLWGLDKGFDEEKWFLETQRFLIKDVTKETFDKLIAFVKAHPAEEPDVYSDFCDELNIIATGALIANAVALSDNPLEAIKVEAAKIEYSELW